MSGQQMSKFTPGHAQPATDTNTTHVPASKAGLMFGPNSGPAKLLLPARSAGRLSWPEPTCTS